MDARAQDVVRRLAELDSGDVLALRPEEGHLEVRRGDRVVRLHHSEEELLALLDDADSVREVWGEDVEAVDGAARFISVHLDESLATGEPHPSGWWTYRSGSFHPEPPWEAPSRRDAKDTRSA